ncbi:type II toxin-antitoxin system VapC family toxin [Methylobacterium komagatae]|uniref:Type II toxin-antitoxin system VapC family toxin n=1 Tax=Methylobacterium komagatae TaxID=374425 RepID=A0ABW2BHB0_9HYPH
MRLLLDTHALLWWLNDDAALGPGGRDLIADPANDVLVSTVSLWEIVVKTRIGKLQADIRAIAAAVAEGGFARLDLAVDHLLALDRLPVDSAHRDPFDHLLVAQAIAEDAAFMTADRRMVHYPVRLLSCAGPDLP